LYFKISTIFFIYFFCYLAWYQNGKLHYDDGPAIIDSDGNKEWYFEGEKVTEKWIYKYKKDKDKK